MVNLLRRREMILPSSSSDWDVEWDYTMGLPTVKGWTASSSGSGAVTLKTNGLHIACANSANRFFNFSKPTDTGVLEVKLVIPSQTAQSAAMRACCRIGNSTNCVFVFFYYSSGRKILLNTNTWFQGGQNIGTYSYDTEYTLRITLNGGTGIVELNDATLISNFDTTKIAYPGSFRFGVQNGYNQGEAWGVLWQSVKIKYDRI